MCVLGSIIELGSWKRY